MMYINPLKTTLSFKTEALTFYTCVQRQNDGVCLRILIYCDTIRSSLTPHPEGTHTLTNADCNDQKARNSLTPHTEDTNTARCSKAVSYACGVGFPTFNCWILQIICSLAVETHFFFFRLFRI